MSKDFESFKNSLDHGEFEEDYQGLNKDYFDRFNSAKSDSEKALIAMEYAKLVSLVTVECYHKWLNGFK